MEMTEKGSLCTTTSQSMKRTVRFRRRSSLHQSHLSTTGLLPPMLPLVGYRDGVTSSTTHGMPHDSA